MSNLTRFFCSPSAIVLACASLVVSQLMWCPFARAQAYVFGTGVFGVDTGPTAIFASDFNNDGRTDFAVTNNSALGTSTVSILLGRPDGTFAAKVDYPIGPYGAVGLAAGDFNGDGKVDLAVISSSSRPTLYILLGNGDGTFQSPVAIPLPVMNPSSIAVGDFNGDRKLDLAISDSGSSQVVVLLGNGDGTFRAPVAYPNGGGPVAVGDFNSDGKLDIAVGNGNNISVLLGNGDGTFQPPKEFPAGASPRAIAVGDLNGDGKLV